MAKQHKQNKIDPHDKLYQLWENRIVGHDVVDPEDLLANPLNFRAHPDNQQEALKGSIRAVGFVRSVTVNQRTQTILDGHLRVALALRYNQPAIPVEYVDLSEEEETLALVILDEITSMAERDKQKLDEILRDVQTDEAALQEMLSKMAQDAGIIPPDTEQEQDGNGMDCPNCGYHISFN